MNDPLNTTNILFQAPFATLWNKGPQMGNAVFARTIYDIFNEMKILPSIDIKIENNKRVTLKEIGSQGE